MVTDDLRVDPIGLRITSDHLGVAANDHAVETARHRDEFTDGVSRWRGGVSRTALQSVADGWEARHAQRQQRVNMLERHVTDAAQSYTAVDDASSESIASVQIIDMR